MIADGSGRAIGFALAPGQANELPMAPVLLRFLTALALWIGAANRGDRRSLNAIAAAKAWSQDHADVDGCLL